MCRALLLCAAKFVPMLREPRLSVFYSPPKHDLRLKFDEEEEEERKGMQKPWPDLDLILHDDPEYQRVLTGIQSYIDMEMELLKQYMTVRNGCRNSLVHSFGKVSVAVSLPEAVHDGKEWLPQFTGPFFQESSCCCVTP